MILAASSSCESAASHADASPTSRESSNGCGPGAGRIRGPLVEGRAMEPWSIDWAGRLDEHVFDSEVLRGNPLGDPSQRLLWVWVPPGYDEDADRRYPAVYVIQG